MGSKTGISWTDASWNPWHGCIKISPGCKYCYMYRDKARYGQDGSIVVRSKTKFKEPLKWKEPRRVFTCSWSDFFIAQADDWRSEAWDIIRQTPHLTYQILSKRPWRIKECLPLDWGAGWPNVWLGVSTESQRYMLRLEDLLGVSAVVHFLSYEPALEQIEFLPCGACNHPGNVLEWPCPHCKGRRFLIPDWVIAGGESGKQCRHAEVDWFRSVLYQCKEAGVPFFMKQLGGHPNPRHNLEDFPEDLRVQEFPKATKGER